MSNRQKKFDGEKKLVAGNPNCWRTIMAFNFKTSAQETTSNSILQVGREKIQWKEIDGKPVTIIRVDQNMGPETKNGKVLVDEETGEIKETLYTTVWLKEYPDKYAGGFFMLDKMISDWLTNGNFVSLDAMNDALDDFGGVKIVTGFDAKSNARKITVLD